MGPVQIVQREEGQGLVEFALIVPILLVLILGMIDLGKALGYKNDETNLANQAARIAVVTGSGACSACQAANQNIAQYVISSAPPELRDGTGSISKRSETGFTNNGLYVSFTFPNMTTSTCQTQISSGTACGYCKGDPVQVDVKGTYNFLSFLVGKSAIFGSHDINSSATMRMETSYDPTVLSPPYGFTPTNAMSGKPQCPS